MKTLETIKRLCEKVNAQNSTLKSEDEQVLKDCGFYPVEGYVEKTTYTNGKGMSFFIDEDTLEAVVMWKA